LICFRFSGAVVSVGFFPPNYTTKKWQRMIDTCYDKNSNYQTNWNNRSRKPKTNHTQPASNRTIQTKGYKRYEKEWTEDLNGFRVLFLTNTPQRKESICGFLKTNPSLNFIWITDKEQMFRNGVSARIWVTGGPGSPLVSILGSTLAQKLPLPLL